MVEEERIKAIVVGAAGRMGRTVLKVIQETEGIECAGAVEAVGHEAVGKDAGEVAGIGRIGVEVADDLSALIKEADVLIDFTSAASSMYNMELASFFRKPMVVGSTGFSPEQRQRIAELTQNFPCVLSPNMSAGVNLLFRLVETVARALGSAYDVEILEMHHRGKKDAPSGTAQRLGERVARALGVELEEVAVYSRSGLVGERRQGEIGIMALRAGDVVGEHTVIFATEGERIELTHRASSRETFARGAVRAAKWVVNKEPGLYDMEDVLGLKG